MMLFFWGRPPQKQNVFFWTLEWESFLAKIRLNMKGRQLGLLSDFEADFLGEGLDPPLEGLGAGSILCLNH